jgi:serine/threonine protein kinase/tetratricopeptide (TPR) repeat protein
MTRHDWPSVERIYLAALDHDAARRPTFLDDACGGNAALRRDVESLLEHHDAAAVFLERPALHEAARQLAADRRSLVAEHRVGDFQIVSLIGVGGMGEVYRALDLTLGREVALKILTRLMPADAADRRRFEEEARLASVLNHPNIVTIYSVGEQGEIAYIAMELVRGRTLRDILAGDPLSVDDVLALAIPLADALAAAHESRIAHRDLKPENIMVTADGLVKVLDFGLAKRQISPAAIREGHEAPGPILGTLGYMSPEQAAGRAAGAASDRFSFSVILYELVTWRRAFARDTTAATLSAIVGEQPPSLPASAPAALRRLIERGLAKDPADRQPDLRDVGWELRRIRDERAASTSHNGVSRRRALWLAGAASLSAVAGLATWRFWPHDPGIRSVAVLPFTSIGHDVDAQDLCDGITQSLIDRMSRLASLTVMARSTVYSASIKNLAPREAGRQLHVDAVLTGTLERASGRVQVAAALVDVASGAGIWRHSYDRASNDALSLQDDIALAIVDDGIRLRLNEQERRNFVRRVTNDPEAYGLYLVAVRRFEQESESDYLAAQDLLEQAIARDPQFALAHVALATTHAVMAIDGFARPTNAWPQSNRHVRQALDLDPNLADAYAAVASETFFFSWDWEGAERAWQKANALQPGRISPDFLRSSALQQWALGNTDEALKMAGRARSVDPLNAAFAATEGDFLLQAGQLDTAITRYEEAIGLAPDDSRPLFGLAEARRVQKRFDEAIAARRQAHEVAGDESLREVLARARGADGYREIEQNAARLEVSGLEARASRAYVSPLDLARAYAQLGEGDRAFGYFDLAFADRAPGLVFLNVDRAWDGIRSDVRFTAAIRRVGLPL